MNLHPTCYHYDTVGYSGRKPRRKVQRCAGYRLCFGTRGVVFCHSCDVEIVQYAGGVLLACGLFNTGRDENGGVSGKKEYIHSSSCTVIRILRVVG